MKAARPTTHAVKKDSSINKKSPGKPTIVKDPSKALGNIKTTHIVKVDPDLADLS
jgi:hypothetical protein